ncbi:MAG TPA: hypothetical protein P5325_01415, partial [Candidatus Woesebacteria bacterium]|nr:hypothetical protein [Candidatus Woesebacteria bacterium]
ASAIFPRQWLSFPLLTSLSKYSIIISKRRGRLQERARKNILMKLKNVCILNLKTQMAKLQRKT